jgi:hypothetical protein
MTRGASPRFIYNEFGHSTQQVDAHGVVTKYRYYPADDLHRRGRGAASTSGARDVRATGPHWCCKFKEDE